MTGSINPKNLSWNDGWGAAGVSVVVASVGASGIRHAANQPHRRKQIRWNKFDRAVTIKTAVDRKTISKKIGADMCVEMGVDPQFLDNKAFQEVSSDTKSAPSDSNKSPMASISFSNSKTKATTHFGDDTKHDFSSRNSYEWCDNIQPQKPMEYAQVAEVAAPNSYGSFTSLAKPRNIIPIWGVLFIISTGLYLIVVSKIKNNDWYYKNFGYTVSREHWYQKNFDRSYEKIENLEENQKEILKNQNQILELLKKNEFRNNE